MGGEGLEPSRLIQPTDFKSVAYTDSATRPGGAYGIHTRVKAFAELCLIPRPTRHTPIIILFLASIPYTLGLFDGLLFLADFPVVDVIKAVG